MRRLLLAVLLALPTLPAVAAVPGLAPAQPRPSPRPRLSAAAMRLARGVTIRRDRFGVPHVYAATDAGVVLGMAYAMAEDDFWQLEDGYIRDLGRAAEVYGDSVVAGDVAARLFRTSQKAREAFRRARPRMRALYTAFADGVNLYVATHPDVEPRLLARWEPWWPLLTDFGVPRADSDAVIDGVRLREWMTGVRSRGPGVGSEASALSMPEDVGSNMWAVTPAHSRTGAALLFINPHVGFFGGGQRYEVHLESGEGWRFSGFAILGTPIPRTGHTDVLAWSHTNNYADAQDLYVERFDDPARPLSYRYGSGRRSATEWTDSIRVRRADGTFEVRRLTHRRTHHGPVVASRPLAGGGLEALALRRARDEEGGALEQRYLMARARTLAQWKRAMARSAIVGSNTMYADRDGHVFYVHGNAIPKRAPGVDPSKPLDGSDPATEWRGYWELDSLPQVLDPASGFVINTNSSPWHLTLGAGNPDSARWPAYVAPEPYNARARQSLRLLGAALASDGKLGLDDLEHLGFDRQVFVADSIVPALLDAWQQAQKRDSLRARADSVNELVEELARWSRESDTSSVGMTLFEEWVRRSSGGRGDASDTARPAGAPPSADADAERAVRLLGDIQRALLRDWGTWRVTWGDVNRLQRVHTSGRLEPFSDARPSLPVRGGPPAMGIIFAFNTRAERGQRRRYGISGNSYVAVVALEPTPVARSLRVLGQTADSTSAHFFDQAALYASGRLKPAWWTREEVLANTEREYHPGETPRATAADGRR